MTNQQEAPLRDADATNRGAMTPAHVVALTSAQDAASDALLAASLAASAAADAQADAASAQADATQAKAWSDPATSKTIGNTGTTQILDLLTAGITTLTQAVTNIVRAVGVSLSLRSDLFGAGQTSVKAGPSALDASVNDSHYLFQIVTGNGQAANS